MPMTLTEGPILFSTQLIPRVLDDSKTQTRRMAGLKVINICPDAARLISFRDGVATFDDAICAAQSPVSVRCPYNRDRLWVRETFCPRYFEDGRPAYRADWNAKAAELVPEPTWKPSIFMTLRASRITLEVTEIRVHRLQQISRADAIAEGIESDGLPKKYSTDRGTFAELWDSINGGGSWNASPWVWAISFRRIAQTARAA